MRIQNVVEVTVLAFDKRSIHGHVPSAVAQGLFHVHFTHFESGGNFFGTGRTLVLLLERRIGLVDLVYGSDLVEWKTHNTTLLSQGLKNRLANPPNRIGDKLKSARFVKPLCRLNQAEVALVD